MTDRLVSLIDSYDLSVIDQYLQQKIHTTVYSSSHSLAHCLSFSIFYLVYILPNIACIPNTYYNNNSMSQAS